jgi:hypothetical protein
MAIRAVMCARGAPAILPKLVSHHGAFMPLSIAVTLFSHARK